MTDSSNFEMLAEEMRTQGKGMRQEMRTLGEGMRQEMRTLGEGMRQEMRTFSEEMRTLSEEMRTLRQDMREGFASVVTAILGLHNRFDRIDSDLGELKGSNREIIKEINASTTRLEEGLDGTNCRVDAVGGICMKIDGKADKLVDGVERIDAKIDSKKFV